MHYLRLKSILFKGSLPKPDSKNIRAHRYAVLMGLIAAGLFLNSCSSSLTNSGIFFDRNMALEELDEDRRREAALKLEQDDLKTRNAAARQKEKAHQARLADLQKQTDLAVEDVDRLRKEMAASRLSDEQKRAEAARQLAKLEKIENDIYRAQGRPSRILQENKEWLKSTLF